MEDYYDYENSSQYTSKGLQIRTPIYPISRSLKNFSIFEKIGVKTIESTSYDSVDTITSPRLKHLYTLVQVPRVY